MCHIFAAFSNFSGNNMIEVSFIFAGYCKDTDISAASISQRTIYYFRAEQKWAHLYAELQDGQYMSKVLRLFSK